MGEGRWCLDLRVTWKINSVELLAYLRDSGREEVNHSVKGRMKAWTIPVFMTWIPGCVMIF